MTAVVGTTMALVIAGTAAVSAAGPREDRGPGRAGMGSERGAQMMPGAPRMGGIRGLETDVERRETTIQTADGVTSMRVEQGTADSASDASLSFSLGSGEAVTVLLDEDTEIVAFEEQEVTDRRGWSRMRMAPTEIAAADIEAGTEIVVWSDAEDDGAFVASRVVIQPADEGDEAEATVEDSTEDATTTDA
jgi:hypothetical protein